jgi:hypothetical protein
MIVACCQDAFANSEWYVFEFRSIQFFYCGVVGIAIDVHDGLREVSTEFELGNIFVGFSEVVGGICFEELGFAREDPSDFLCELAVFYFFIVEEFTAFGGIVDDL